MADKQLLQQLISLKDYAQHLARHSSNGEAMLAINLVIDKLNPIINQLEGYDSVFSRISRQSLKPVGYANEEKL